MTERPSSPDPAAMVPGGWDWFAAPTPAAPAMDLGQPDLARACARIFATADGALLLAHLRRVTLNRALGPATSDAALRALEGQRALVLTLEALARASP